MAKSKRGRLTRSSKGCLMQADGSRGHCTDRGPADGQLSTVADGRLGRHEIAIRTRPESRMKPKQPQKLCTDSRGPQSLQSFALRNFREKPLFQRSLKLAAR